jgi:flagellar M-ring protein FliF
VRERTPVKASVVVTPFNGRVVAPTQVQAIVHLVASSVPYLSADDVSVVDNLGNLLTRRAADAGMGLTTAQVEHKQQIEETYRNRIVQLLEPVVGEGNVRSQVDLVVNFTQVETTSEDFDVRKEGSKTRSEMLSEERSSVLDPSGVPGALSNTPPPETNTDTKPSTEGKDTRGAVNSKSTRNYELDKVVRHVKNQTGVLERVSVAVVIKERAPVNKDTKDAKDAKDAKGAADTEGGYTKEEIERLQGLVRGVVGFDEKRGDSVTIVPAKFEVGPGPGSMIPWYENDMVVSSLKVGLATFVLIALLFTVVRPVVRAYLPQPPAPVTALAGPEGAETQALPGEAGAADAESGEGQEGGVSMAEGETLDDFKARLKASAAPKKSSISADMLDTANTYDDKVALIRMLVQEDSGRVASVLKGMIKRDLAG